MKKTKIVLVIVGMLLLATIAYAEYLKVFSPVTIEDKIEGGYKLVGLEFKGPYSKAGKYMEETDKKLNEFNLSSKKGFGIYYDAPKSTDEKNYRSYIGQILEEKDYDKIESLKSAGFRVDSIPKTNALVSYFPIKSSLSYIIGPMKTYPKFTKYMNERGYDSNSSIEIYDSSTENITFIMHYVKK